MKTGIDLCSILKSMEKSLRAQERVEIGLDRSLHKNHQRTLLERRSI